MNPIIKFIPILYWWVLRGIFDVEALPIFIENDVLRNGFVFFTIGYILKGNPAKGYYEHLHRSRRILMDAGNYAFSGFIRQVAEMSIIPIGGFSDGLISEFGSDAVVIVPTEHIVTFGEHLLTFTDTREVGLSELPGPVRAELLRLNIPQCPIFFGEQVHVAFNKNLKIKDLDSESKIRELRENLTFMEELLDSRTEITQKELSASKVFTTTKKGLDKVMKGLNE